MSSNKSEVERIIALREASNVERCHTVPHSGSYSVGKHSYDATCLLLVLHPNPSAALLRAVLLHDSGERWVGDLPAPAKWDNGQLGILHAAIEQRALAHAGISSPELSEEEINWLNGVDRFELWLWCHDQLHLGNQNVWPMKKRLDQHITDTWNTIPDPLRRLFFNFGWERLPG